MHFVPSTLLIAGCANIFVRALLSGSTIYNPMVCVSLLAIRFDASSFSASEAIYPEVIAILRWAAGGRGKKREKKEKKEKSLWHRGVGWRFSSPSSSDIRRLYDDRIIPTHTHAFLLVTEPSNRALPLPRLFLSLFWNRLSAVSYKVTSTCSPILPISFSLDALSTIIAYDTLYIWKVLIFNEMRWNDRSM